MHAIDGPVVVLGSTGLLGQALMREAAARGWHPIGLSRRKAGAGGGIDLARVDSLVDVLAPLAPALVVNAAACTDLAACERDPGAAYAINARLPALLARCGRERGLRWVHVSTDHYHGGLRNLLHDEFAPVTLFNEYARTKYAGEAFARTDVQALVLRTNIVGRRGWAGQPSFAEWAMERLAAGEPFDAYTDVWASSLEAGQCAAAIFDLVLRGARGLLNVACREASSKAEFIRALATATGHDPLLARAVPRPASAGPRRANAMGLAVARTEHLLGRRLPDATEVTAALARAFADLSRTAAHRDAVATSA